MYLVGKSVDISRQIYPTSQLGVSAGYCQTAVVDESWMIRAQMGKHNRSVIVAVYRTPCAIPPRNNKQNIMTKYGWMEV
jgi:hypothetical protein